MNPTSITFYRGNDFAGNTRQTPSGTVQYVGGSQPADICFKKYTADFSASAEKRFFVTATRRRYATLDAAAAAVAKLRAAV